MSDRRDHDPVCPGYVHGRRHHAEFRCKSCDLIELAREDERAKLTGAVLYTHTEGTHRSWCTDPTCAIPEETR